MKIIVKFQKSRERDDPKSFQGLKGGKIGHVQRTGNQNRTSQQLH